MSEEKLEKFKFATITGVNIKVNELEDKIEIDIDHIENNKDIVLGYKPYNHHATGDFQLTEREGKITIDRSFMVGTYDGDVDWDMETIYPCDRCEGNKKYITELHEKIKTLKDKILLLL